MKILYNEYSDFPKEGVTFIDLTPSLLNHRTTKEIVEGLMKLHFKNESEITKEVDYIISPDARGFIWGGMVAMEYNIGFIPVRKSGKLPDGAIQNSVEYKTEYSSTKICMPTVNIEGKKLLFIDDVYATGGTFKAIKKIVEEGKGTLIGGSVIINLEIDKNAKIKSLIKNNDL